MKKTWKSKLAIVALAAALVGCTSAPEQVKSSFTSMYPNATDIEWEQEDDGWEAEFEIGEQEFTSFFTVGGEWMETETAIAIDSLPDNVLETLYSQYPDHDIVEAEWVETPEFKGYEVEVAKMGEQGEGLEIILTPMGNVLSEEKESGSGEEDDD